MTEWELTAHEALAQLMLWEHMTLVMRDRILDDESDPRTSQGDAHLFAMAVRQTLRFVDLVKNRSQPRTGVEIEAAIERFNAASPDAKDIRDVLDHFDEYMLGVGHRFPAGDRAKHSRPDLVAGTAARASMIFYERGTENYRLHVMPRIGTALILDVKRDSEAILALAEAVRNTLDRE